MVPFPLEGGQYHRQAGRSVFPRTAAKDEALVANSGTCSGRIAQTSTGHGFCARALQDTRKSKQHVTDWAILSYFQCKRKSAKYCKRPIKAVPSKTVTEPEDAGGREVQSSPRVRASDQYDGKDTSGGKISKVHDAFAMIESVCFQAKLRPCLFVDGKLCSSWCKGKNDVRLYKYSLSKMSSSPQNFPESLDPKSWKN
jgi:hypothetical protein